MLKNALKALFDHFESYLCQFLLVFFVLVVFYANCSQTNQYVFELD